MPQLPPARPLQRFFVDFPGLTAFIGRIVLTYFDNTVGLDPTVKRNRQTNERDELIMENEQKRKRESDV